MRGENVLLLEALQAILGMLIKAREVSGEWEYAAGCYGVYTSCYDALFGGVSAV